MQTTAFTFASTPRIPLVPFNTLNYSKIRPSYVIVQVQGILRKSILALILVGLNYIYVHSGLECKLMQTTAFILASTSRISLVPFSTLNYSEISAIV